MGTIVELKNALVRHSINKIQGLKRKKKKKEKKRNTHAPAPRDYYRLTALDVDSSSPFKEVSSHSVRQDAISHRSTACRYPVVPMGDIPARDTYRRAIKGYMYFFPVM